MTTKEKQILIITGLLAPYKIDKETMGGLKNYLNEILSGESSLASEVIDFAEWIRRVGYYWHPAGWTLSGQKPFRTSRQLFMYWKSTDR